MQMRWCNSLDVLPDELLLQVLSLLGDDWRQLMEQLSTCPLVNRRWNRLSKLVPCPSLLVHCAASSQDELARLEQGLNIWFGHPHAVEKLTLRLSLKRDGKRKPYIMPMQWLEGLRDTLLSLAVEVDYVRLAGFWPSLSACTKLQCLHIDLDHFFYDTFVPPIVPCDDCRGTMSKKSSIVPANLRCCTFGEGAHVSMAFLWILLLKCPSLVMLKAACVYKDYNQKEHKPWVLESRSLETLELCMQFVSDEVVIKAPKLKSLISRNMKKITLGASTDQLTSLTLCGPFFCSLKLMAGHIDNLTTLSLLGKWKYSHDLKEQILSIPLYKNARQLHWFVELKSRRKRIELAFLLQRFTRLEQLTISSPALQFLKDEGVQHVISQWPLRCHILVINSALPLKVSSLKQLLSMCDRLQEMVVKLPQKEEKEKASSLSSCSTSSVLASSLQQKGVKLVNVASDALSWHGLWNCSSSKWACSCDHFSAPLLPPALRIQAAMRYHRDSVVMLDEFLDLQRTITCDCTPQ